MGSDEFAGYFVDLEAMKSKVNQETRLSHSYQN